MKRTAAVLAAVLALLLALALAAPRFFGAGHLVGLVVDGAPVLVLAVGMTFVMLAGHIDVSIGSLFAACGVLAGVLAKAGWPMPAAAAATIAAGACAGAAQGALVAFLRWPAIVVTLATMVGLRGALRWATSGEWVRDLPGGFTWFGLGQGAGQAVIVASAFAILALSAVFLRRTAPGRAVYAVGCDAEAARLLGVRAGLVAFLVFAGMGALTAVAALLSFPRYPAVEVEAGRGLEMQVIAAVVVGGVSVRGGRGSLLGTLFGVSLLAIAGAGLVFLRVEAAWERALHGLILLLAVLSGSRAVRGGGHG
jgi:rhamnose transport system permease protein